MCFLQVNSSTPKRGASIRAPERTCRHEPGCPSPEEGEGLIPILRQESVERRIMIHGFLAVCGTSGTGGYPFMGRVRYNRIVQSVRANAREELGVSSSSPNGLLRGVRTSAQRMGRRKNKPTTLTMEQLTREQREGFVRLLNEAKQRREQTFERELEEKARREFLPKLMERQGIGDLLERISKGTLQLTDSVRSLQGMELLGKSGGFFRRFTKPEDVQEVLERMKRPHLIEHEQSMKLYDHAVLQVLSAQNLDEAQQVVASLI
jgi:hypothetical protein